LAWNFPPHCRLIAAQRAAGEASFATLKEQPKPSALLLALPAADAALVALMQDMKSAAAAISIINLMASLPFGKPRVLRRCPDPASEPASTFQVPAIPDFHIQSYRQKQPR
jgi:hypothetical protein